MTIGEELQLASIEAIAEFANKGVLLEPTTDEYDSSTGLVAASYVPHKFEYVNVTNQSLPKESTLSTAGFRQSYIYFTFPGIEVDEVWGVISGESKDTELPWTDRLDNIWYDENTEEWVIPYAANYIAHDIVETEKIVVNDIIVGYYALLQYQEGV